MNHISSYLWLIGVVIDSGVCMMFNMDRQLNRIDNSSVYVVCRFECV